MLETLYLGQCTQRPQRGSANLWLCFGLQAMPDCRPCCFHFESLDLLEHLPPHLGVGMLKQRQQKRRQGVVLDALEHLQGIDDVPGVWAAQLLLQNGDTGAVVQRQVDVLTL